MTVIATNKIASGCEIFVEYGMDYKFALYSCNVFTNYLFVSIQPFTPRKQFILLFLLNVTNFICFWPRRRHNCWCRATGVHTVRVHDKTAPKRTGVGEGGDPLKAVAGIFWPCRICWNRRWPTGRGLVVSRVWPWAQTGIE